MAGNGSSSAQIFLEIEQKKIHKERIQLQLDQQNAVWFEFYRLFHATQDIKTVTSAFAAYLESNSLFQQIKKINHEIQKLEDAKYSHQL